MRVGEEFCFGYTRLCCSNASRTLVVIRLTSAEIAMKKGVTTSLDNVEP